MSMESICLGCMNPLPEGSDRCSICGFTAEDRNPAEALALATRLQRTMWSDGCCAPAATA